MSMIQNLTASSTVAVIVQSMDGTMSGHVVKLSRLADGLWWQSSPICHLTIMMAGTAEQCELALATAGLPAQQPTKQGASRPVICITDNNRAFPSIAAAAHHYGLQPSNLSRHINRRSGYSRIGGHRFK